MSALITGGGGSLGMAIGKALAARGVAVALLDVDLDGARRAASEIQEETGVAAIGISCDVTDETAVSRAWTEVADAIGMPEIVVNNAGRFVPCDVADLTLDAWETTMALQLTGPFLVCREAARRWIPAGLRGSIVNIASNAAVVAHRQGSPDYGASKAGLVGLTVDLAIELGAHGIRANAVLPGTFRSRMNAERLADPAADAAESANVPIGRLGEASEIAAAAVFLALDGTYTNGAALSADGGTIVKMF
jgi:NAD(P)-dependent dehydrogenase (short-subunit alcohol dehydrogenase family)